LVLRKVPLWCSRDRVRIPTQPDRLDRSLRSVAAST
jgi:hypothetical protein